MREANSAVKRSADTLSSAEQSRVELAFADVCKEALLPGWRCQEAYVNAAVYLSRDGLKVIVEAELVDSELWLHVSFSRKGKVPSYDDTMAVKRLFVGRGRKAIQVFPSEEEHFSLHPNCLHLYSPIDRDPLPDFRAQDGAI
jgi:hypothetical protein